jgi:O-antigen/teichoic acid export membrane protein
VLTLLIWGFFLSLFTQLQGWSIGAIHQERKAFFMPIIATAAFLIAAPLLISAFHEKGLAIAGIIPFAVTFVLFGAIVRSALTPRSLEPGLLWKVLLANAIMAVVTYAVRSRPMFISIPAAALTYGAMVIALKIVTREELAAISKLVRKRMRKSRPAPAGGEAPPVAGAEV